MCILVLYQDSNNFNHSIITGKKKTEDGKEESEEIKHAREEFAAKRAKFPGLCLPDDIEKVEVTNVSCNNVVADI